MKLKQLEKRIQQKVKLENSKMVATMHAERRSQINARQANEAWSLYKIKSTLGSLSGLLDVAGPK